MNQKTNKITRLQIALLAAIFSIFGALALPLTVIAQGAPASTPPASSFDQRLAQRKAERNPALDEKTQKRLVTVCTNAQGKIRALQQKTTPALDNRAKSYQQMDAKLWIIIGKLKLAERDTFNLEKQRTALAQKSKDFQATSELYQQVLDDLLVVNCKADPAGFKALVDTARLYRTQLRTQTKDIHGYVVNEIKTMLSGFAADLQTKSSTGEGS
jgi:hypothetical protein